MNVSRFHLPSLWRSLLFRGPHKDAYCRLCIKTLGTHLCLEAEDQLPAPPLAEGSLLPHGPSHFEKPPPTHG